MAKRRDMAASQTPSPSLPPLLVCSSASSAFPCCPPPQNFDSVAATAPGPKTKPAAKAKRPGATSWTLWTGAWTDQHNVVPWSLHFHTTLSPSLHNRLSASPIPLNPPLFYPMFFNVQTAKSKTVTTTLFF
ncbi:hypothetical protein CCHR01_10064 [Colletotrichum chrysophilum]|uniref:Uncharacterized protein n=1 Tax=Colletotrichum chrysophilum TaxID=1836956 RepID=A0AAD9EDK8_9PEZI|nr:hypothetical protein CCHR01_10064 [Colletotrichum chrysophilum]